MKQLCPICLKRVKDRKTRYCCAECKQEGYKRAHLNQHRGTRNVDDGSACYIPTPAEIQAGVDEIRRGLGLPVETEEAA
jgi:hypothetical protein